MEVLFAAVLAASASCVGAVAAKPLDVFFANTVFLRGAKVTRAWAKKCRDFCVPVQNDAGRWSPNPGRTAIGGTWTATLKAGR